MQKFYSITFSLAISVSAIHATEPKHSTDLGQKTIHTSFTTASVSRGGVVCDTLQNYLPTDSLLLYTDPDGGYISGQNSYGDIAKAERYTGVNAGSSVGTVLVLFGEASAANATDTFTVNIWDGTSGTPGSIIVSTNYTYQMAADDVAAGNISVINFTAPATVPSDFFAGVAFDYITGDTIAIVTSEDLSVIPATAWELFGDGLTWVPFDDPDSWGQTVAHVILPVVCGTTGITNVDFDSKFAVFPTVASENVSMLIAPSSENVSVVITDVQGSVVYTTTLNTLSGHNHSVNVSSFSAGSYFIRMTSGNMISTKKFMVQR
jgi:hypothetical protein